MARQPSQESAGTQAVHHPVAPQHGREILSDDLPVREVATLDDLEDRIGEVIVAGKELVNKEYLAELAFMEEYVLVYLNRGREKFAPRFEMVGVNGQVLWIEVEQWTRIKRKFLEVIARSMPMDIRTNSGETDGDELTFNKTVRSLSANFSFSVQDENPKGAAWLAKIRRES